MEKLKILASIAVLSVFVQGTSAQISDAVFSAFNTDSIFDAMSVSIDAINPTCLAHIEAYQTQNFIIGGEPWAKKSKTMLPVFFSIFFITFTLNVASTQTRTLTSKKGSRGETCYYFSVRLRWENGGRPVEWEHHH